MGSYNPASKSVSVEWIFVTLRSFCMGRYNPKEYPKTRIY